jgi:hypothetical protein
MSAAHRTRYTGTTGFPLQGPAKKVLADSLARVTVNVPLPVIGEPLTLKSEGKVKPTCVTVPLPLPLPVPHAVPVLETQPELSICKQL